VSETEASAALAHRLAEDFLGERYDVQGFTMYLSEGEHIQRRLIEEGVHEWAETALLPTFVRRGWTVCDAGANIGYYSLLFSRLVGPAGKVYAFEPNPALLPKLRRHVDLNAGNIEICPLALGAAEASRRFDFSPLSERSGLPNFGGWSIVGDGSPAGAFDVSFVTLDAFVASRSIERVHFVKADIEGGELELLRGARDIIIIHKPIWMIEFRAPDAVELKRLAEIRRIFDRARYTLARIHKKPWPHIARFADEDLILPVHFNVIAYPGSHPIHP
jgi:FkbM family methyltransferase